MPNSSSPPKGVLSSEYLQGRFNSKQIANRLVVEAVGVGMLKRTLDAAEIISGPVNQVMEDFFHELVTHMGHETDLATEVPGIPGLRPWNPLSLDYVKHKQSEKFWIYTMLASVSSRHWKKRRLTKKRLTERTDATLINSLSRLSGGQAFGGAVVTVLDAERTLIAAYGPPSVREVATTRTVLNRTGASASVQNYVQRFRQHPADVRALRFRIEVKLWTSVRSRDFAHIEDYMVQRGLIDQKNRTKLLNKGHNYRPLIRPWMAYYSQVIIPNIIRRTLDRSYHLHGEIGITGGRTIGAL